MNKSIIIISDFYKQDLSPPGGAELNDDVLFSFLESKGLVKHKIRSNEFDTKKMIHFLEENKECTFLISNFANLHFRAAAFLSKNCRYFIYEHDYKFHKYRNPLWSRDFILIFRAIPSMPYIRNTVQRIPIIQYRVPSFGAYNIIYIYNYDD